MSTPGIKTSLLIHPEELDRTWIHRCTDMNLTGLALHPVGGADAHQSLAAMLELLDQPGYRQLLDEAADAGLDIEYEMHALRYLLPKDLFEKHPDWFRMNQDGQRTADFNFCVTNHEAMDYVAKNAANLVKKLYCSSSRYFLWMDDVGTAACCCPNCSQYSPSEQQLMVMNRILQELQKDNPHATLAHLAYTGCLQAPEKVKPLPGIFLEYAPFDRDFHRPITDDCAKNTAQWQPLEKLLQVFGCDTAKVLDYWLDNSLYSQWTKPPKSFQADDAVIQADFQAYYALGFRDFSSFACYLGKDYTDLYGEPDLSAFERAYQNVKEKH